MWEALGRLRSLTSGLQTLDHPEEDVGLDCALCPVLLQRGKDLVGLLRVVLPAQPLKVAVVQH